MTNSADHLRLSTYGLRHLWLVLVLLVGLLGMHGLASNHASMSTTPTTAGSATTAGAAAVALDPGMAGLPAGAPTAISPAARTQLNAPHGGTGMAVAGLCFAVLAGALLLAAGRRAAPERARPADRPPPGLLARVRALPPTRPPDLVAGLCVSRT